MPAARKLAASEDAAAARHALVMRLKRIEGQLRGVQKMIEGGEDCELIAQQLSAGRKALDKAFFELLACAIEHPQFSPDPRENKDDRIHRMARTLAKFA